MKKNHTILTITIIILVLLIFLSNVETSKLSYLESVASTIINPIQRIITDFSLDEAKAKEYMGKYWV